MRHDAAFLRDPIRGSHMDSMGDSHAGEGRAEPGAGLGIGLGTVSTLKGKPQTGSSRSMLLTLLVS